MRPYEVIIPVRNGGQSLINSIESLIPSLASGRVFLTISDNFSTDGAAWKKTIETLPSEQWRVISPPESLGRVEHWSWAFAQARSPWVKPLMTGDRIHGAFWDWADQATTQFPQAGVFFSSASLIDPAAAHPQSNAAPLEFGPTAPYDLKRFQWDAIHCQNPTGALTQVMIRADVMKQALPFEPAFAWSADWRFYHRCYQQVAGVETKARLVCLDRSIVRLSTSWKGLRGSLGEEWRFSGEQARLTGMSPVNAFFKRSNAIGTKAVLIYGRKLIPRRVRGFLTSITGRSKN